MWLIYGVLQAKKLAQHVCKWRGLFKKGKLEAWRVKVLDTELPTWRDDHTVFDAKWMQQYKRLRDYIRVEKRLPNATDKFDGHSLGAWLVHQRARARLGTLHPGRLKRLNDLNIPWSNDTLDRI